MRNYPKQYSDEKLLNFLKKEAARLGRAPTSSEIDSLKNSPSSKTYCARFGRWSLALKRAGIEAEPINTLTAEEIQQRKEVILKNIKELSIELERVPKVNDAKTRLALTSIERYFGSWNNALIAAGIIPRHSKKEYLFLSDDELLKAIKAFHKQWGRLPKISDFYMKKGLPSPSLYKKRFGGWSKAIKLAGFEPRPFPYRPVACEFEEICFIKQCGLSYTRKRAALKLVKRFIDFRKDSRK